MKVSAISPEDAAICKQYALIPGSPFQVSYRFAPKKFAGRLLALRAFLEQVRSVPSMVSEPQVGLVKLAWWQGELQGETVQSTQHPVVRAMWDSGFLSAVDRSLLEGYISSVAEFTQTETYEDEAALRELAEAIGGREARLEMGQGGGTGDAGAAMNIGSGSFLYRGILNPGMRRSLDSWWLPMSLQARYGVSIYSVGTSEDNDGWRELLTALCSTAREWLVSGIRMFGEPVPLESHHLVINARVKLKRLDRMLSNAGQNLELSRGYGEIVDVLTAWRTARKLRRYVKET